MRVPVRADFALSTISLARALVGAVLAHDTREGIAAGRIVETEAYLAVDDPASHSHRGPTRRNASMFGEPGCAYVYACYGVHRCFNVVTAPRGTGEAVLVRALEPLEGTELMRRRRGGVRDRELCSGPGKLCVALGIGLEHDGRELARGSLRLWIPRVPVPAASIDVGPRIGITRAAELPLRFVVRGTAWASRRLAAP
ncbi:MAG: DNA-3-methyladenine glycosylase [Planctomycetota bacterium]|nr:DNA-3-methyladenine glycosylase [Planctomycetota bacterium]